MWRSVVNDAVLALADPVVGERGLDIGAGIGAGALPAAARGARVIAVEPTPYMRRALGVRCRLSGHGDRIEIVDGSAERLPVDDASIDVAWAVNTMHHWLDPEVAASEIARVLRPGGRVVLVDEDFADPAHPDYEEWGAEHGPEHHGFTMVEADRMGALLGANGLGDVEAGGRVLAGRPVIAVTATAPA